MGISQKTENIYSKVMPELFEHQNECIGNHPEVANSQILNDKFLVPNPDPHRKKSGVSKLCLQISICALHVYLIYEGSSCHLKESIDESNNDTSLLLSYEEQK